MSLQGQSDYFFFREGVVPMWEDEANRGGGMFQVTAQSAGGASGGRSAPAPPAAGAAGPKLDWDALWLNALLAVISCALPHEGLVNGVNFGRRHRGDRLQLWMRPTQEQERGEMEPEVKRALVAGMADQHGWQCRFSPFGDSHSAGGAGGRSRDGPRRHH